MKKKLLLFFLINVIFQILKTSEDCFFKTCVVCDNDCDSNNTKNCSDFFGKTFFSARPQDSNSVRRILTFFNTNNKIYQNEHCNNFNVSFEYQRSFNSCDLAKWFFFNGKDCMTVGIPNIDGDEFFDVDAIQFGLSLGNVNNIILQPGLIGEICAKPVVENFITDLDFYFDLNHIFCNWWTRFNIPIVRTTTDLKLSANGKGQTQQPFPAGLFNSSAAVNADPTCDTTNVEYDTILEAFKGDRAFGSIPELKYGKFKSCKMRKTGVAGIHMDFGRDFYTSDCAYVGASLHVVAPTGNRPNGKFVFEPVVGANKSWQIGATLQAFRIWEDSENKKVGIYFYGIGTHLFKANQTRLFNLKNNGAGSQYLLLKKIDQSIDLTRGADRTANILAGDTKIGADFMLDASIMLQLSYCNKFLNFGYNFWLRTKEKRDKTVCFRNFYQDTYAIKGDLPLSNFDQSANACVSNTFSASESTIGKPAIPNEQERDETVFVQINDINFDTPLHPTTWSNKVFATLGINDLFDRDGFISVTGEVEFGRNNSALNQWGIIFNGGIYF